MLGFALGGQPGIKPRKKLWTNPKKKSKKRALGCLLASGRATLSTKEQTGLPKWIPRTYLKRKRRFTMKGWMKKNRRKSSRKKRNFLKREANLASNWGPIATEQKKGGTPYCHRSLGILKEQTILIQEGNLRNMWANWNWKKIFQKSKKIIFANLFRSPIFKVRDKFKQALNKNKEEMNTSIGEKTLENEERKNFFFKSKIFGSIFTSRESNYRFTEATSDIVAKMHRQGGRRRSKMQAMKSTVELNFSGNFENLINSPKNSSPYAKDF